MKSGEKSSFRCLTVVLAMAFLLSVMIIPNTLLTKAETFNDTNPDLTLINIDGSVDSEIGPTSYIPQGELNQSGGNYTIRSNSYCAWGTEDDVSFGYRKYNVAPNDSDTLTVETTLDNFYSDTDGKALHPNASAGIMIRSGLENTASTVFLHVRAEGLMIVYRQKTGGGWSFISAKSFTFPVQLKVTVQKNTVECRYKNATDTTWRLAGYASIQYTGPLYAGLTVHSVDVNTFALGKFSDLKFYGTGSYTGEPGGSSSETPTKPTEPVDPDIDLSDNENIVLYETFSDDNKLAIAKDAGTGSNTKFAWSNGQKLYNYDTGKYDSHSPLYADKKVENGNRFLYKSLLQDSIDFIGSDNWSDYKVSMDFQYTDHCDISAKNAKNLVALSARSRIVEWYGYSDYAATMQNEWINNESVTTVSLYKHVNNSITAVSQVGYRVAGPFKVDNFLGDGKWHNLGISVFDNIICIYYDGEKLTEYVDDGNEQRSISGEAGAWEEIIGFGKVGIKTYQTDCFIDNIIVELIPDIINGDYDNYVGGNWDAPIPDSVKDWTSEKKYSYFFNGINGDNTIGSKKKK